MIAFKEHFYLFDPHQLKLARYQVNLKIKSCD